MQPAENHQINSTERPAYSLHQTFLWFWVTNTLGHMQAHLQSLDVSVIAVNNTQSGFNLSTGEKKSAIFIFEIC